ncbi:hypothetical protein A5792_29735 [Mycolicibacterium peregrinum]|uniref:Uncharacterized protein n=1 Tax=Mycolicibacterium peregrinum TaxID=43304 RepID=A0A1A0QRE3_MYCPR|nr:hypothetical protein A5792_29735 [Mycolicibacterium peregrinum]
MNLTTLRRQADFAHKGERSDQVRTQGFIADSWPAASVAAHPCVYCGAIERPIIQDVVARFDSTVSQSNAARDFWPR